MTTPYDVLGVPPGAHQAALRAAYRRLAKQYHPDSPTGDAARFRRVRAAYDELKNGAPTAVPPTQLAYRAPVALNIAISALFLALAAWCWFRNGQPQSDPVAVFGGWALILMAWRTYAHRKGPLRNPIWSLVEGLGRALGGLIGFAISVASLGVLLGIFLVVMTLLEHAGIVR